MRRSCACVSTAPSSRREQHTGHLRGGLISKGYLVVVVGRGHVEGSLGVPWQIARMTTAPVHAFTLAWGGDPPCYRGDKVWRPSVDETIDKLLEGDRK